MKIKRNKESFSVMLLALGVFLLLSIIAALGIGPVYIEPKTTANIILRQFPCFVKYLPEIIDPMDEHIILIIRMPRVFLGALVGASLSVCGTTMQALVRNKLADPFILGASSGASTFAVLGMLFGAFSFLGVYSLPISAFIGSTLVIVFVYMISIVHKRVNVKQLLLSGVVISMIMSGITEILRLSAPNWLGLNYTSFWTSGSLASAKWVYMKLPFIVFIICLIILIINYRGMNVLLLGDESAGSLGVNVVKLQKLLIFVSSILTGVTISVSGTIGFVGLIVPNFTRLLVGSDHKRVLPISALLGSIFVIWIDVIARILIAPEEIPVGVLTSVIGGPVFIILLKQNMSHKVQ